VTTIAYRAGILAADSRTTTHTDAGGARVFICEKLFRKSILVNGAQQEVILATAGETFSGLVFVDWLGSGKDPPDNLIHGDADFSVLVLQADGLYEWDKWCRGEKVLNEFYAIGSGAKAAMGAMYMGAGAAKAVEVSCLIDPYSAPPIHTMKLNAKRNTTASAQRKTARIRKATPAPDSPTHVTIVNGKPAETAAPDKGSSLPSG